MFDRSRWSLRSGWAYLALALIPCLLQSPALFGWLSCNPIYSTSGLGVFGPSPLTHGTCWVDGNTGGTVQSLAGLSARQLLSGRMPWWNHFSGAGLPLASEMQSASFFLPFIFLLGLFNGFLYLNIVLRILAGFFTFAFLRELGLVRSAAMLGGVLFELNGTFTWLGDAPIHPIPFLPLLMFGIERCRSAAIAGRPGGQLPVALGIAFSVLGGFPEVAFADGVLALLWSMSRLDMHRRLWPRYVGRIVAGGICGLLLSSPALVPFLHDLPSASIGGHVFAQVSTVGTGHLASVLFPAIFGAPYADGDLDGWNNFWGYVPPASALLAVLGVATRPRDRGRVLLLAWFTFCLAGACRAPIIGALRDMLPGFDQINFGRYVGPSAEFSAVTLAALALDHWCRTGTAAKVIAPTAILIVLGAASLLSSRDLLAHDAVANRLGSAMEFASIIEAAGATALLCALLSRPSTRRSRALAGCVLTAEAMLMALPPVLSGTGDFRLNIAPVQFLKTHLGLSRFYAIGGALLPNYGAYFEIASVNEFYVPLPKSWDDYARSMTGLETPSSFLGLGGDHVSRVLDFAAHRAAFTAVSVEYLLVPAFEDPLAGRNDFYFQPVFDDGRTHIYRLPDALPYLETVGGQCSVYAKSRDDMMVDCKQSARLLRREMAFRGWTARVNDRRVKVHTAGLLQSIDVPAGKSTIAWRFTPQYVWVVTVAFSAGLSAFCAFTLADLRVPRRRIRDTA